MSWIVPQKGDYINIIDCFDCHRQSAFRCFNLNCDRKPIVHRYCKRCAEEYKKRPEDDCPGCAAALIAMEKSREEASRSSPTGEKTTIVVDGQGRPICDLSEQKKD